MTEALALLILAVGALLLGFAVQGLLLRRRAVARVAEGLRDEPALAEEPAEGDPVVPVPLRRWPAAPWLVALAVGGGLRLLHHAPWPFVAALSAVALVLGLLAESWLATRRAQTIEGQLADALDLVVATLRAGTGLLDALDAARREAREPLRTELDLITSRIRLGDDPRARFLALAERVPLETFRLLSFTLAVHWEVGGSLAPTLSTVGRTIRERIELARRIAAQTTQARLSAIAFLGLAYFVVWVSWRSNPARVEGFLTTSIGELASSFAIGLQALGLIWMARVSRLEP
jgi:tight adherence protein B